VDFIHHIPITLVEPLLFLLGDLGLCSFAKTGLGRKSFDVRCVTAAHKSHNTAPAAAIGVPLSLTALDARQTDLKIYAFSDQTPMTYALWGSYALCG
jgi:hypothetical protein